MMSSESDPLLPKGNSAPEIQGYGFSKARYQPQNEIEQYEDEDDSQDLNETPDAVPSPLRTIITTFIVVVSFALIITLLIPGVLDNVWDNGPFKRPKQNDPGTIEARVSKILSATPLIDGHDDLAMMIRFVYENKIYDENFRSLFENGGLKYHVDLPRLKTGKVSGTFWSAFVGCPANNTDFSSGNYADIAMTLSQIDVLHRLIQLNSDTFSPPYINSSSALAGFNETQRLLSPIAIEGLHQIGNSFSILRLYHSLGVKYATLTHNCHNAFADAALITDNGKLVEADPHWGGLSERGMLAIREMNRIGMLVDLAHVSKDTMLDVLGARPMKTNGSGSPIIFSHSSAYGLCPHPRNVQDDVLHLVKKSNSIVMVNFSPDFISCIASNSETGIPDFYPRNSTLHQVARHVTYIGDLIGYNHVGLGSDFDGIFSTPEGLEDVSKFPALIAELLRMGVSDEDAAKVVGLNILRVWREAEKVAVKMQTDGVLPIEDTI